MTTRHTETREPADFSDLITPEMVVGGFVDLLVIGIGVYAVLQVKLRKLREVLTQMRRPHAIDFDHAYKARLFNICDRLKYHYGFDWVGLGIFSNGKVTDWGYHFSEIRWDVMIGDAPKFILERHPASSLSVSIIDRSKNDAQKSVCLLVGDTEITFYPIWLSNILIAAVAVPKTEIENLKELSEIRSVLLEIYSLG